MTTHQGGCHCGKIAFTVDGDISGVVSCNCSMCQRKGILMWFVPRESLKLTTSVEDVGTYTFNNHKILHRFCPHCGIGIFDVSTLSPYWFRSRVNIAVARSIFAIDASV